MQIPLFEEWRPVKGYEGLYEVSSFGNVRTLYTGHGIKNSLLSPYKQVRTGHLKIVLYKNGRHRGTGVHRLVANAFIPNPMNYPIINHKDEDPSNNFVENLEWCTYKYNTNYGSCKAKIGMSNGCKVNQYDKDGKLVAEFYSIEEAKRQTGINNISQVLNGTRKYAGGYIWKRKE